MKKTKTIKAWAVADKETNDLIFVRPIICRTKTKAKDYLFNISGNAQKFYKVVPVKITILTPKKRK